MKISDLRECVVLAETRSFTETARRLYTTQSAVSKHIQALEQDVGMQLFVRNQSGVYLTKAGRVFVSNAEDIIRKYSESIAALDRLKSGVDETLNVGYLAGAASMFLPDAIVGFSARFPNIDVQPKTMEIDDILEGLDSDSIDMGISTEFVPFSSRFETCPLYQDRLCAIVPRGHRLAERESVSIRDLAGETVLLPSATFMVREVSLIQNLLTPVLEKAVIKENVNDIMALLLMMKTRRYVTILFDHVRNFGDLSSQLRFIPLEEYSDPFDIVAVWKRSSKTDAIAAMAESLQEALAAQSPAGF